MASKPKGNGSATRLHRMSADYGIRAATALNLLLPGQHRAKALQRMFDVSERTAKYLLAGQHWTTARLSQAGKAIEGFDELISTPNLHARMDAMETQIAELQRQVRDKGDG
jgi:hypothetical protein